jgi:hypothetical protein
VVAQSHRLIRGHLDRVSGADLAAALEGLGADVAALFGPFIGLLGQHGADQTDDRVAVGEDPDDVGAPADLLTRPVCLPVIARLRRPKTGPPKVAPAASTNRLLEARLNRRSHAEPTTAITGSMGLLFAVSGSSQVFRRVRTAAAPMIRSRAGRGAARNPQPMELREGISVTDIMAESAVLPSDTPPRPRWPLMLLRIVATLYAVATVAQPFLAGMFLSGSFSALKAHEVAGQAVGGLGILALVCAILDWRLRGGPAMVVRITGGLLIADVLQIFLGYDRILALHVPLGVAIVGGVGRLAFLTWRGAAK